MAVADSSSLLIQSSYGFCHHMTCVKLLAILAAVSFGMFVFWTYSSQKITILNDTFFTSVLALASLQRVK